MRFILMTYSGADHVAAWESATPGERQAEIDRVVAWFRENGTAGRIVGGEELGYPRDAKTVRRAGVSDGPFIETKEMLGGFIVLEVPDEATALRVASAWPGLEWPGDAVEVRPIGDSAAEGTAGG
jgi:hypothetical protein